MGTFGLGSGRDLLAEKLHYAWMRECWNQDMNALKLHEHNIHNYHICLNWYINNSSGSYFKTFDIIYDLYFSIHRLPDLVKSEITNRHKSWVQTTVHASDRQIRSYLLKSDGWLVLVQALQLQNYFYLH